MTVTDLLARVYENVGYASSPASAVTTRITNSLNQAHRAILREPGLARLRDTTVPLTFASVASQKFYGLPAELERITAITETDNDRLLQPISLQELRITDPGLSNSGTPWAYVPLGYRQVPIPPEGTGVWAASSAAGDSGSGYGVKVNAVTTSGLAIDLKADLTGTTRVQIGTATDLQDVRLFSLEKACAGVVSLYNAAAAGTTLAQIGIGQQSSSYFTVQLYPTPSSAITYYVDGTLAIPTLDTTDGAEVPLVPTAFHDLLSTYATAKEWEYQDDPRYATAMREFSLGLQRLKHHTQSSAAEIPVLGRGAARRKISREGAWAPATW